MFHARDMVDLAKTPDEVKKEIGPMPTVAMDTAEKPSVPVYPWGTCIRLEDAEIAKMGMTGDMPPAGAIVHGCFEGRVKCSRPPEERIASDGTKSVGGACIEIEMMTLGFAGGDEATRGAEEAAARNSRWYGGEEPDGDEG